MVNLKIYSPHVYLRVSVGVPDGSAVPCVMCRFQLKLVKFNFTYRCKNLVIVYIYHPGFVDWIEWMCV